MKSAEGRVLTVSSRGQLTLDQTLFYATSGGQPCDRGEIHWDGGTGRVQDVRKSASGEIAIYLGSSDRLPPPDTTVQQELDWERRHLHMRIHTALHLLSVVIPLPVTGGAITTVKGRLDFDMPEALTDRVEIERRLNGYIEQDLPVSAEKITDEELAANPHLVKTMSVRPPTGAGEVRLIRIGTGGDTVDLQPCGGTHVSSTGEIGRVRFGKIVKKGRRNRRVNIHLV